MLSHGRDDASSSKIYQSVNGRLYLYLIEKNELQAVFLIDKINHEVGHANNYLNRFPLVGFTIDGSPQLYDISTNSEKTGFDPKLEIQPNCVSFYASPQDISAGKRVTIQFYDN